MQKIHTYVATLEEKIGCDGEEEEVMVVQKGMELPEFGPLLCRTSQTTVYQLSVGISETMHLSTHPICRKVLVEFKVTEHFVLSAADIMHMCFKQIKTRHSNPITQAMCTFWPVMTEFLHQILYTQQCLRL